MVYLGGLKKTKDVIITGLRAFFVNKLNYRHLMPPELLVNEDIFTTMNIYDTHPQSLRFFPMLVIAGSGGQMLTGGIGNNFASEVYDDYGNVQGYLYGGFYNFSLEIEAGTRSVLEREVLMDLTVSALKFSLRRRLEYYGILIKEVSYGGENKLQYDSNHIYTSSLSVQTYSEWYDYFNLLPIKDIKVNMNNKKQETQHNWYIPRQKEYDYERDNNDANYHLYDTTRKT